MMEKPPFFFFFLFPSFCSRCVNNLNQASPAIVSHPTNLIPTKMSRGSEGQTGGASQWPPGPEVKLQLYFLKNKVKKTRKHLETREKDAALLICALYHPHPKGSSSSWPW